MDNLHGKRISSLGKKHIALVMASVFLFTCFFIIVTIKDIILLAFHCIVYHVLFYSCSTFYICIHFADRSIPHSFGGVNRLVLSESFAS
jgi:hypothetical protein